MTDQQRFDTIAALGNEHIYTPNMDRLVRRGISLMQAYSTCPVCMAARYTIHTGCEPPTTRCFLNGVRKPREGQGATMTDRCGPYLPQRMRELGYRTFGIGAYFSDHGMMQGLICICVMKNSPRLIRSPTAGCLRLLDHERPSPDSITLRP